MGWPRPRSEGARQALAAERLGLQRDRIAVLLHTGSRGLGHQVCSDHLRTMDETHARYGIELPDRQLACVPLSAPEGRRYLGAMRAAANSAFCNRQLIAHQVREVFARHVGRDHALRLVYDVGHNTAKIESHDGRELCVHRKGATRGFGPSHSELPAHDRGLGQPVFIPGSMGTASYVLLGTDEARDRCGHTTRSAPSPVDRADRQTWPALQGFLYPAAQ